MTSTAMAAARLLREYAEELKRSHTIFSSGAWPEGESEAKAAYEQHIAIASALEAMPAKCLHQIQESAPVQTAPQIKLSAAVRGVGVVDDCDTALAIYFTAVPRKEDIRALHDALTKAPSPQAAPAAVAVPDGWKLVPELPTQDMCESAKYGIDARLSVFKWADGYKAMLSSAPEFAALAATPAAAPVVLPEPDAAIKKVMAVVEHFGTASRIDAKDTQIFRRSAVEQEVHALLAKVSAPAAQAPMQCVECNSCGSAFDVDSYMAGYTDGKGHCPNCPGIDHSAPQAQADALDATMFEQRMSDWSQEDALDAERYRFIVEHKLILSGGTEKFGWPIAPFGVDCHRYIDAARAAIAAAKGE